MKNTTKLGHPVFILCVLILLVNDWYLKSAFPNALTGKLSDFTGLFAFPFLISVLYPHQTKRIHILTAILFIYWKSDFSQVIIDTVNKIGLPVHRTVDYTDYLALVSIFFSYQLVQITYTLTLHSFLEKSILGISCIAFIATSLAPRENRKFAHINKEYTFTFSKRELVSRLNIVQFQEIRSLRTLTGQVDFDSEKNIFHYRNRTDTLALLLDTQQVSNQDTITFKTSFAEMQISGDETTSKLKLIKVYMVTPIFREKQYRNKAIRQFEKHIVKKLQNYP